MSIRGVSFRSDSGKWVAYMSGYPNGGRIGHFRTEAEAIDARRGAELLIDGYHHADHRPVVEGSVALVPLLARRGLLVGQALIDADAVALVGDRVWSLVNGYARASEVRDGRRTTMGMHQVVLPGDGEVDHISGDRLDNRRSNLRRCCRAENAKNKPANRGRKGQFKGVCPTGYGRFYARIGVDWKQIYLGTFDTAEQAATAYDAFAAQHHGEFAKLNFPNRRAAKPDA